MQSKLFPAGKYLLTIILLTTITSTYSQGIKEMIADNEALTKAYWGFVRTEYTYYNGERARLRTDHFQNRIWQTEELKKALLSFQSNELKQAQTPVEVFENKYGDGEKFANKFASDSQTQIKALSSKTNDRFEKIQIESDFKNENQLGSVHYANYKSKLDEYNEFKKELAKDIFEHALAYESRIGKYNKDVIVGEMKKLLECSLWLDANHKDARLKLSQLQ